MPDWAGCQPEYTESVSSEMYQRIISVAVKLAGESDVYRLCSVLLKEAELITCAQAGTLYLVSENELNEPSALEFLIVRNHILNMDSQEVDDFPAIPLFNSDSSPNKKNVACYVYHQAERINIENVYAADQKFDFSGTKDFDEKTGFSSKSFLTVPLIADSGRVIGIFQLINSTDNQGEIVGFADEIESAIQILANFAAKALENQLASQRRRELLANLSGTGDTNRLIEQILREAKAITNADGGSILLLNDKLDSPQLEYSLIINDHLGLYQGGVNGDQIELSALKLYDAEGRQNFESLAVYSATTGKSENIVDVYECEKYNFSNTYKFDESCNYRSTSFLSIPLKNHESEVIGVLQLINARDYRTAEPIAFSDKGVTIVNALATYAAIALHNRILLQDLRSLLDAFIQCIAQAIDAKSSHTSNHCQRVPLLMELIAQAACEDQEQFKDFDLTDDDWYEIRVASWLHDCGKLATPDSVLDKSTKLHLLRDGIDEIEARIAALKMSMRVDYLEALSSQTLPNSPLPLEKANLEEQYKKSISTLEDDAAFILTANKGGEYMSEEARQRVRKIAEYQWTDIRGHLRPLLTPEEVDFLCIERGTLSHEERQIINDHMVVTIDMLESLPFPKKLRRVPEIASGHHEKMDGTGFPRGLKREEMSIPARMMAIADIFEALTSRDRPYKDPMKVSMALNILKKMSQNGHVDPDLYQLFIRSRVWEKYADSTLMSEQRDVVDVGEYLLKES